MFAIPKSTRFIGHSLNVKQFKTKPEPLRQITFYIYRNCMCVVNPSSKWPNCNFFGSGVGVCVCVVCIHWRSYETFISISYRLQLQFPWRIPKRFSMQWQKHGDSVNRELSGIEDIWEKLLCHVLIRSRCFFCHAVDSIHIPHTFKQKGKSNAKYKHLSIRWWV